MKASLAKEVNRIVGLVTLAALAALAVGHIWPLLVGLIGYIFWSTRQLFSLYSWLVRDDHTEPPDSIGLWGEFYTRLEHLFQKERRAQETLQGIIHRAQQSLLAVFWNLPNKAVAVLIRGLIFPSGKPYSPPSDTVIQKAAAVLLTDSETRDRLTLGIYLNSAENDPSGRIERAFQAVLRAGPAQKKLDQARRSG